MLFAAPEWPRRLPGVLVVLAEFAFEVIELASQVFVRGHDPTQPHESPHDGDVDFDGTVATEDRGERSYPCFEASWVRAVSSR